jgi:hypothetical protein
MSFFTILLLNTRFFLEKLHPSSRAYKLLVNGCLDEGTGNGRLEREIQIVRNKDDAVILLHKN